MSLIKVPKEIFWVKSEMLKHYNRFCRGSAGSNDLIDMCHEKTDLKVFVVVIVKEGWARVAAPILLLV